MSLLLLLNGAPGVPPTPATWPAHTWIPGTLFMAAHGNAYVSAPLRDLRAGAIAMTAQTAQDMVVATTATQWGRLSPVAGRIPKFTGTHWEMVHPMDLAWPIGSIYRSALATNPAILLGVGTWTAFSAGRVTVAFDPSDPVFDTAEDTGGSKTVTLTESELPSHTHVQNSHNHTQNAHSHTVSGIGNNTGLVDTLGADADVMDDTGTMTTNTTTATNIAATAVNQSTGGGGAHQNLMPYIVCYCWVRRS